MNLSGYKNVTHIVPILLLTFIVFCNTASKTAADCIVLAKGIYICNEAFEKVEAMALKDGKIMAYGLAKEILADYQSDSILNTDAYIYPGFIDAHSHFMGYAGSLLELDLSGTSSLEEVIERTVAFARDHQDLWIRGRGWDQNDWIEQGFPNNTKLNILFPDRPVILKRVDGHAALVNAKALELAGIDINTTVRGGEIEQRNGILSGLLIDNAVDLVSKVIPPPGKKSLIQALKKAEENCFAAGLTYVSDAGLDLEQILLIDSLQQSGDLKIRLYAMANPSEENFAYFSKKGTINTGKLFVSSFKIYADGALGSRGARLKAPYCDREGHSGLWLTDPETIDSFCHLLYDMEFQVNTHCIGDSANRKVMEIYGKYLQGKNDLRWRIEHAQVVSPEDRALFSQYSIIPSVQPSHATSDMGWAEKRLCRERMAGAYAYKSLLETNGYLPLGTDFPVEAIDPLQTFYAAVYRKNSLDQPLGGFMTEEALTARQALLGITHWASKANKTENLCGSLEVGKDADFVVLDRDLMTDQYILQAEVKGTYLKGLKVY